MRDGSNDAMNMFSVSADPRIRRQVSHNFLGQLALYLAQVKNLTDRCGEETGVQLHSNFEYHHDIPHAVLKGLPPLITRYFVLLYSPRLRLTVSQEPIVACKAGWLACHHTGTTTR